MKKISFLIFTLLFAFCLQQQTAQAQDCGGFVNPNFDVVSTCPSYYDDVAAFTGWDQVTVYGTVDGTCDCATWWDSDGNGELGTCPTFATNFVGGGAYSYYTSINAAFAEYVGNCLTTPLQSGETYQLNFDIYQTLGGGSIPISIIGYQGTTCPTIPFQAGTTGHDELCGQPGWATLATQNETSSTSDNEWTTMTFTFTAPSDISYIAVGSCNYTGSPSGVAFTEYFVYDNFCIPTKPVCEAGNSSPSVSNDNPSNVCPQETVDLSALITSNPPAQSSLVWYTNNNTPPTGTPYANPSAATTGTYYAFYYDSAENCYSPAAQVEVTVDKCCSAGTQKPIIKNNN